jgi:hypothetical protein
MAQTHFTNLLIVVVVAFAVPLVLGLAPQLRLPAVVLEIVAGIAIGTSGLGGVQIDEPVHVLKPTAAGLIAAGLLSVIVFPVTGLSLLRRSAPAGTKPASTKPSPASAILSTDDRVLCRTPQTAVEVTA